MPGKGKATRCVTVYPRELSRNPAPTSCPPPLPLGSRSHGNLVCSVFAPNCVLCCAAQSVRELMEACCASEGVPCVFTVRVCRGERGVPVYLGAKDNSCSCVYVQTSSVIPQDWESLIALKSEKFKLKHHFFWGGRGAEKDLGRYSRI